jgi:hypothetical protein
MPNPREPFRPVVRPVKEPIRSGVDQTEQPTTFIGQRDVVIETPNGPQRLPTTAEIEAYRRRGKAAGTVPEADRRHVDIPRAADPHTEEVNKMRRMVTALELAIAKPQKITATLEMIAKAIPRIHYQETLNDTEARREILPRLHAALSQIERMRPEIRQDANFQKVRALIDEGVSVLTSQDGYTANSGELLLPAQSAPLRTGIYEQPTQAILVSEPPTTFFRTSPPPESTPSPEPPPATPPAKPPGFFRRILDRLQGR